MKPLLPRCGMSTLGENIVFGATILICSIVRADDIETIDGKEYKNVRVTRTEPDGLVVSASYGIIKIPFEELSSELQQKYNFDPQAAATFRREREAADAERSRAIEAARQKRVQAQHEALATSATPSPATQPQSVAKQSLAGEGLPSPVANEDPRNAPNLTLTEFEERKLTLVGKLVRLSFSIRDAHPLVSRDGQFYEARVYDDTRTVSRIRFPAARLHWFTHIVPKRSSNRDRSVRKAFTISVYGRVVVNDRYQGPRRVVLDVLGNEVFTDMLNGPRVIWR
jgi:hypothetical protein